LIVTARLKSDQMITIAFAKMIKNALEKGLYVKEINQEMFENNSQFHEQIDEFKTGGTMTNIEFDSNNIPRVDICEYAISIKNNYPKIWEMGDRESGDEIFNTLESVVNRGYWVDSEIEFYKKWKSYISRHQHDYRIVGVVSMLKHLSEIEFGFAFMKTIIEKEVKQQYRNA
ncbi:MAG: hypothetical protein AABY22_20000, partial [Nanoarchaeota archaeon]